jgi:hypothetical protein
MNIGRFAAGLMLASTLCLGGCPEAPTPMGDASDPDAAGTDIQDGGQQLLAGTVTARFGTGAETVMTASECAITNGGANGIIRAADGAFELSWANGTYRLIWNHADGLYQGEVTGEVLEGGGATFNGSANGQTAQGFAVCLGGM